MIAPGGQSKDFGGPRHTTHRTVVSLQPINVCQVGHDDVPLVKHHTRCEQSEQDRLDYQSEDVDEVRWLVEARRVR